MSQAYSASAYRAVLREMSSLVAYLVWATEWRLSVADWSDGMSAGCIAGLDRTSLCRNRVVPVTHVVLAIIYGDYMLWPYMSSIGYHSRPIDRVKRCSVSTRVYTYRFHQRTVDSPSWHPAAVWLRVCASTCDIIDEILAYKRPARHIYNRCEQQHVRFRWSHRQW